MDYSAYVRVLLSVWVGLGLGQLVQSLHQLRRFKGEVRWDWIPVTWAGLALLMFVQTWWAYFELLQYALWLNMLAFLLPVTVFILLYLICASAFPEIPRDEARVVDMRAHYEAQHRYFFGMWAALLVLAIVVSVLARGRLVGADGFRMAGFVLAVALASSASRRLHAIVTLLSLATLVLYILLFSLRLA